jgi:hypothetical protein
MRADGAAACGWDANWSAALLSSRLENSGTAAAVTS